ncbi:MAG: hypothetical protein KDB03_09360 [Planctomycetales bacterium]|nr:hypothetical protein [Planctomycetales bacterium]
MMHFSSHRCLRILRLGPWLLAVACLFGCSSDETEEVVESPETDVAESGTLVSTETSATPTLQEVAPDGWLVPLNEDENFFAAPDVHVEVSATTETESTTHAPIRLLGFSGEDRTIAILKVGTELKYAKIGDDVEGAEVLEMEDRSITFQRDRQRWTLSLLDQPLVNAVSAAAAPRKRSRNTNSTTRLTPKNTPVAPSIPEPAMLSPGPIDIPNMDIPMDIEPIQMPDLSF